MSSSALAWALYEAQAENPTERLMLVYFGDAADDDGYVPFVIETLAETIGMEVPATVDALSDLVDRGLVALVRAPWPGYASGPLAPLDLVRLAPEARLHVVEETA